jgi:hypothetical protein
LVLAPAFGRAALAVFFWDFLLERANGLLSGSPLSDRPRPTDAAG